MRIILALVCLCGVARADGLCREPVGMGLRVSCLGDSNTDPDWHSQPTWCDLIAFDGLESENCGYAGATAAGGFPVPDGPEQILDATGDVVVMAFGSNDLGLGLSEAETVDAMLSLYETAEATGALGLVASVPYRTAAGQGAFSDASAAIVNTVLEALLPEGRLIDITSGFGPEHYLDTVHFNALGHELRAERVRSAVVLAVPEPGMPSVIVTALCALAILRRKWGVER